ncbi:uncharacterized protein YrzB (UPF0473 family) [Bacilli bacterium PM5-3]|nr:uncharacterized protein YrzB (UPF0473 family) [Bacilli bacterium PM5-3]MDH6603500.1 uncharacterized protein YrzB (UPF0473 family) [Bacilli bacterium PM5-9]
MQDQDNKIVLVDELGNEKEFEILLTFENEELNKKYVYYYDPEINDDEDAEMYVSIYDDEGNIFDIEDPEEQEMVEEVYNTFLDETGIEDEEE